MRLIAMLLLSCVGYAQCIGSPNCTVKAAGGGGYTAIQACATAMANGDTCKVFAGTYAEHVTLTAGGVGSYKTLTVNSGDTVNVLDFTINSHNKLNGFSITNPSSPNSSDCVTLATNATDFYITNNTVYACGSHGMIFEPQTSSNVNHGFIQGNTFSYPCSTSSAPNVCTVMLINGDYHLIENNDISHIGDGPYMYGAHNVLRNNRFHDIPATDCGSNSGNCHIDVFQADANVAGGSPNTQYLLIEGNTVNNMVGTNTHALGLFQGQVCNGQCFNGIVRFNTASHFGSGAILDDNSFTTPSAPNSPAWINVKSYNNSWIDANNLTGTNGGATNGFLFGSTGGAEINDLFYYAQSLADFNPYFTDASTVGTFTVKNNLAYCTGSPCNLRGKNYGSGAFTDDPGNVKANPLLVNYGGNDFHLSAGSPAIAAGTYLTAANGAGSSSTALTVTDAGYFQDGAGITGVQPDWIRIGAAATVQISSINYSTNVITLATSVSWSNNDPVYLFRDSNGNQVLNGANPDIGAFGAVNPAPALGMFARLSH